MKALTAWRIHRIASEHGWSITENQPGSLSLHRGPVTIHLRFNRRGSILSAMRYLPGSCHAPTRGRFAYVRGWLTEEASCLA